MNEFNSKKIQQRKKSLKIRKEVYKKNKYANIKLFENLSRRDSKRMHYFFL